MFPFSSLMNFTMIFCMTYPKGWRSVACKLSWKDELWTSWQGCSLSGVASYSSWQPSWWGTQGYSLTTYAALVMTAIIKTLTMIMRRFKCWQRKIYTDKHNDDADAKCYFNADKQTIQRNANNIIIFNADKQTIQRMTSGKRDSPPCHPSPVKWSIILFHTFITC